MSKVKNAFENKKAFIPFITAGDPDAESTVRFVLAAARAGADLIEIGIPFSDPTAEGPVIQEADSRALAAGMTVRGAFDVVRKVRAEDPEIPLAFMTYLNPVFKYRGDTDGSIPYEPFLAECSELGIDALIIPDLPFEEQEEILPCTEKYGVDLISMISPTSEERIRSIAESAKGFIYVVSSMGVTGVRSSFQYDAISRMISVIRETNPEIPCAVGFGISTPEQAEKMAAISDGAIVGSAIIRLIHRHGEDAEQAIFEYVSEMKAAVMKAGGLRD